VGQVTYVGLLRGVNIGRSTRVAMAELRALVEQLGYHGVRTILNSGNVVFAGPRAPATRVAGQVELALARHLGVTVRGVVLTARELAAAVAANPLVEIASDPSRLVLAVPSNPKGLVRIKPLLEKDWAPEAIAAGPRAAYFWCPGGFHDSPAAEAVRRAFGDSVTMRNWATVGKLLALTAAVRSRARHSPALTVRRNGARRLQPA
jgi:uncharacterized protein (DUF1697 family)